MMLIRLTIFSRFGFFFFRSESEVEISIPNAKFCTFNPSACTFKTTNEGEKNSKENTMPTTLYRMSPLSMKFLQIMSNAR